MVDSHDITVSRIQRGALVAGIVGLVVCGLGAAVRPDVVARSYLVAYNYCLGLALGSLAILMLHHLTGGRWGLLIRRLLESATRTFPLMALLFLPIFIGRSELYSWTNADVVAGDPLLQHKSEYLNVSSFAARAILYFAIWICVAYFLNRWSRRQDETNDPRVGARLRTLSGPGLLLYGLTISFAAIDWVMSIEPQWYSTIFAVVFGIAQPLAAMAFAITALTLLAARPPLSRLVAAATLRDVGNLLLALVMFWTYVAFSQFLLIWVENMPEETAWYMPRLHGGWQWIAIFVILTQFALPFLLLLFRHTKNDLAHLVGVAILILATCFVTLVWQIVPAFPPGGLLAHWLDIVVAVIALMGVGGLWVAMFLWQLQRMPLVPLHAPLAAEVPAHG